MAMEMEMGGNGEMNSYSAI